MATETDELKSLALDLKAASDAVKKSAETTNIELRNLGDVTSETKLKADEALAKQAELQARLDTLEQKASRRGSDSGQHSAKSLGQLVVEDEALKSFMASKPRGSIKVSIKDITSATSNAAGSAGSLIRPDRAPGIGLQPRRRLVVRDLLAPGETTSNAIEYIQEKASGTTNAAAVVAEMALKPQSDVQTELKTSTVSTIAHWARASRQVLDDAPMLRSYIDGHLLWGLQQVEEAQLLKGSGSGGDLNGLWTQATAYSAPITIAGATRIDQLRLMILQNALANFPVDGLVLNPADWASIELMKNANSDYIFAQPQAATGPTMWGRPVVETTSLSVGEALAGAFRMGAQIFDRQDAAVEVSTEDRDNFIRNAVTILAEERLALAVYFPKAFTKATLVALPT